MPRCVMVGLMELHPKCHFWKQEHEVLEGVCATTFSGTCIEEILSRSPAGSGQGPPRGPVGFRRERAVAWLGLWFGC